MVLLKNYCILVQSETTIIIILVKNAKNENRLLVSLLVSFSRFRSKKGTGLNFMHN